MVRSPAVYECVANVSEGRDAQVLDRLATASASALLDLHVDPDHHRSVFTLGGSLADVEDAARTLAEAVAREVDLAGHQGVHPRLGALDVVPFVPLAHAPMDAAVAAARRFGAWLADRLAVPVFYYEAADPQGRSLPDVRRQAFRGRHPDAGPGAAHPRLGTTAVGARAPLVAVNCVLTTSDPVVARGIADAVRERDGGLPGVRALGFALASRRRSQVSMNLVDLAATGIEAACTRVRDLAEESGHGVEDVELVGLVPRDELERSTADFLGWAGLDDRATVEARLEQPGLRPDRRG